VKEANLSSIELLPSISFLFQWLSCFGIIRDALGNVSNSLNFIFKSKSGSMLDNFSIKELSKSIV